MRLRAGGRQSRRGAKSLNAQRCDTEPLHVFHGFISVQNCSQVVQKLLAYFVCDL
jgi:hypothetical protein